MASWPRKIFKKKLSLTPRFGPVDVQMQARRLFLGGLEEGYVEGGGIALKILRIGGRERLRVFFEELQCVGLIEARQQRGLESIQPRAHRCGYAPLQGVGVDPGVVAGAGPRDDMDSGEIRFGDLHLGFHAERGKRLADDFFDALADLSIVFFARHVDQAGIESAERIAPQQHADARALLQAEYSRDDAVQLGDARLEQFVARKGFENVLQRLAVMAVRSQCEVRHHLRHLVTQHGDLARIAAVGGGSPQSQESLLADQTALGVEMLDPDVIKVAGAVNGGLEVGLGDEHDVARAALAADVARQCALRVRGLLVASAQYPQTAGGDRLQGLVSLAPLQPVLAIAEEGEVAILHPSEQRDRFAQIARVEAVAQGAQILGGLARGALHLEPVGAGDPHIAHAALDLRRERLERGGIDDSVDFDVLEGLQPELLPGGTLLALGDIAAFAQGEQSPRGVADHRKDRMRQKMQSERALRQCETDRIHEEGHVIVHHLDDGVRRGEAVLANGGVEYPHQGGPAPAMREHQVRQGRAGQLLRIARGEIFGIHIGVVVVQKARPVQIAHGLGRPDRRSYDGGHDLAMLFGRSLVHG